MAEETIDPIKKHVVSETLAWCNYRRLIKGLPELAELPKGYRNNAVSCPCGAASGLNVGSKEYWGDDIHNKSPLPSSVIAFVHLFDGGFIPEYDLSASKIG